MVTNELAPFIMIFGSVCFLAIIFVSPIWIYTQLESFRRSIRYLREDLEEQETEIQELRRKLRRQDSPNGEEYTFEI